MKLTIHMIQDRLAAYNAQYRPGQDMNQSFAEVRLMGSKGGALVPDTQNECTTGQLRPPTQEGAERAAYISEGGDGVEDRPALRCAHFFTVNREGVCLADLMNDLLDCFQRLNDWERRLEEAILRGKSAQELVDYLKESVLTEFQSFVASGKQYKDDSVYVGRAMDAFYERTEHLRSSMEEIANSIGSISKAMDEGAAGITGAADSTKNLEQDMANITGKMDVNKEIVEELKKQMEVFVDL